MNKRLRKLITIAMFCCLIILGVSMETNAATYRVEKEGVCGENAKWKLDSNGTLTIYGTGDMYSGHEHFAGLQDYVDRIVIEEGITSIGDEAFHEFTVAKELIIPNTVTYIGSYLFYKDDRYLSILPKLTIPDSVTEIGEGAFNYCLYLEEVTISANLKEIPDYAFNHCHMLQKVTFRGNVEKIGKSAFYSCVKLQSIHLPDSVTEIGESTFLDCWGLEEINIPKNLRKIGRIAFSSCKKLQSLEILPHVKEFGEHVFYACPQLTIHCYKRSAAYFSAKDSGTKVKLLGELAITEVFSDVHNDWYTDYVEYVFDKRIMTGISGTTQFQPNANITKAQVAQIIYNLEGKPEPTICDTYYGDELVQESLQDIYAGAWYIDAVLWNFQEGIITGDTNAKKFFPNASVTREQLALMLYRYAEYKGYRTRHNGTLDGLLHADSVSNWASKGINWAVGVGLISGIDTKEGPDLAPQGNATRAQMAAIMKRFEDNVKVYIVMKRPTMRVFMDERGKNIEIETNSSASVKWSSSDTSVLSVDQSGKLTLKKPGYAVVTAAVEGKEASCMVNVFATETTLITPYGTTNSVTIRVTNRSPYTIKTVSNSSGITQGLSTDEAIPLYNVNGKDSGTVEILPGDFKDIVLKPASQYEDLVGRFELDENSVVTINFMVNGSLHRLMVGVDEGYVEF